VPERGARGHSRSSGGHRAGGVHALSVADAARLQECVLAGGVAVFPCDTVYGVCCDPDDRDAVARLYELKGRPAARAAAVMFFSAQRAMEELTDLAEAERAALRALLPGPVTLLLANPARRFAPACGADPATLGLRVPLLPERLAALTSVTVPVMQSSANISGRPDARTLAAVPRRLRAGADLVLDGGQLPGTPSTVVDLRGYAAGRGWSVLREGALSRAAVERLLDPAGPAR
jgi:L-threonylcarbamoyladenylate synthase